MTQTPTTPIVRHLGLDGHDSELFSFIGDHFREQLEQHPNAHVPLWTFGRTHDDALSSVSFWNGPGCLAFTSPPNIEVRDAGFINWGSYTTNQPLIVVTALVLVRHLFVQGYRAALDGTHLWVAPVDRGLERLRYIRGMDGFSKRDERWRELKGRFFDWAHMGLEALTR